MFRSLVRPNKGVFNVILKAVRRNAGERLATMRAQIHFEVFARRAGGRSFNLELATEDRELALDTAEAMLTEGGFVAVKVSKETLDPGTGEFKSVSIFNKGDLGKAKPKVDDEDRAPPCVSPADLYNIIAQEP